MIFVWVHVFWFGGVGHLQFSARSQTFRSLEAIFLSTFILISQNHETQLSERRNELDLQIDLLTEQENTSC